MYQASSNDDQSLYTSHRQMFAQDMKVESSDGVQSSSVPQRTLVTSKVVLTTTPISLSSKKM